MPMLKALKPALDSYVANDLEAVINMAKEKS